MLKKILKTLAVISACIMAFPLLCSCAKKEEVHYLPELHAEGDKIFSAGGEEVILRGVNAGGLFVTEHWMTGFVYGSTPSNDYRSLTQTFIKRFGEEKTKRLWQTYRENWWTEEDFQICADMGINVIRLPFTYMNVDFAAITDMDEAGKNYDFSAIEQFVNTAAEYGIYTILDLHGAYGSQNGQDHSGQIIENVGDVKFYSDETLKNLTVKLWKELSLHFKDNGSVAGYDILNEPGEKAVVTDKRHWDFYDEVYKAIRANGDNHIVIFESCWDGKNLPKPSDYGWENCVYSFHHYAGDKLNYPAYCASWNKKIEEVEAMQFGVPLQMGEFTNYTAIENWKFSLNLLNTSGWHWTTWTYKVWGKMPWGVINIRGTADEKVNAADDEYEDILLKFQRLNTSEGERYTFADGTTLESLLSEYAR